MQQVYPGVRWEVDADSSSPFSGVFQRWHELDIPSTTLALQSHRRCARASCCTATRSSRRSAAACRSELHSPSPLSRQVLTSQLQTGFICFLCVTRCITGCFPTQRLNSPSGFLLVAFPCVPNVQTPPRHRFAAGVHGAARLHQHRGLPGSGAAVLHDAHGAGAAAAGGHRCQARAHGARQGRRVGG